MITTGTTTVTAGMGNAIASTIMTAIVIVTTAIMMITATTASKSR
jgi:hypothetical protein